MRANAGRNESTSARNRRVRSTTAGAMCVSDACTKVNSDTRGTGRSAKSPDVIGAVVLRQNEPTARNPSGPETKTIPVAPGAMPNAPDESVVTTAS
jgi:hypothetical protein